MELRQLAKGRAYFEGRIEALAELKEEIERRKGMWMFATKSDQDAMKRYLECEAIIEKCDMLIGFAKTSIDVLENGL